MVKKTQLPQHIMDAAMELAAERGWQAVTLADVAARARLPLTEVYSHFRSRNDILQAFLDHIDERMLHVEVETGSPPRDRLFDVAMRRFEALTPYKRAVRAILRDGGGDPVTALCGAQRFGRSMCLLLEAAGISSGGLGGLARVNGMAAVYLYAMRTWLNDDTPDMARTMATLDKALRRADTVAGAVWRHRGDAAAPPQDLPSGEAAPGT